MNREKLEKLLVEHNCKRFTKDGENYVCFTTKDFGLFLRHIELSPTDNNELNRLCFEITVLKNIFGNKESFDNYFNVAQSEDVLNNETSSNAVIKTLTFALDNINLIGLEKDVEKDFVKKSKDVIKKLKKSTKKNG